MPLNSPDEIVIKPIFHLTEIVKAEGRKGARLTVSPHAFRYALIPRNSCTRPFAGTGVGPVLRKFGIDEEAVEIMPEAVATRAANGLKTTYKDVWDAHLAERHVIKWLTWLKWSSPPCQAFSLSGSGAGRKALTDVLGIIARKQYIDMTELREQAALLGDERIGLVLSPLHYAVRYLPSYIVMEQVPPVLPVWEAMAEKLRELGYSVWTGILHAEQFGVPQTRDRAILMARKDGEDIAPPKPTHSRYYPREPDRLDLGVKPWVSMADALGWGMTHRPYPTIACSRVSGGPDKEKVGGSGARSRIYKEKEAGRWIDQVDGPKDGAVNLTVAETAKLQTYPDDFVWAGSRTKQFVMTGNAVPLRLTEAILNGLLGDVNAQQKSVKNPYGDFDCDSKLVVARSQVRSGIHDRGTRLEVPVRHWTAVQQTYLTRACCFG